MKRVFSLTTALLIVLSACYRPDQPKDSNRDIISQADAALSDTVEVYQYDNEYMVLGTLFHQQAAEYRALCYQTFNLGKMIIDEDLKKNDVDKHRIVIVDIDETVLDNSPYQAQCIIDDINYPVRWDEWCLKASANAVPGALDFLNYARANGLSVFYVTNRKEHLKEATIQNLKKLGFPMADNDHVIMRTDENSKEGRRNKLLEKYHISLLAGDNLNDLTNIFEEMTNQQRANGVDKMQKEFGRKFIVLPNSMYGDWETSLYNMDKKQSDSIKFLLRHKALKGFRVER